MNILHPKHLIWVLLYGLLLVLVQRANSVNIDDLKEVTAPNSTTEKDLSLKTKDTQQSNAVPLSDDLTDVVSPKEHVPDKSERIPKTLETPNSNAVVSDSEFVPNDSVVKKIVEEVKKIDDEVKTLTGEKNQKNVRIQTDDKVSIKIEEQVKRLESEVKNLTSEKNDVVNENIQSTADDKTLKKLAEDVDTISEQLKKLDSENAARAFSNKSNLEYEYSSPKGRTLNYNSSNENADLLKNTVPSEPKAVKLEENVDKEGERWIKKQRGISGNTQSNPEFKSRVNKERNLSGSYLPALASLNAVNSTTDTEISNDKYQKYQRRKRPWTQANSSDLSLPEETTVWSLASMKVTPKEKHYDDIKPVVSWSTVFNKPTTEYQSKVSSTSSPLDFDKDESDWIGISKMDVPSIKFSTTESPLRLTENITNPSSSINLIDTSSDKEVSNETSRSDEKLKPNATETRTEPKKDSNNIINDEKIITISTPVQPSSTESIKHLSVYPSPISNSVNDLQEDEEIEDDGSEVPGESSHNKETTSGMKAEILSTTENSKIEVFNPSFNNSQQLNITNMFLGKDSYASNFNFSTTSPVSDYPKLASSTPKILSTSSPNDQSTFVLNKSTEEATTTEDKIVRVTSTMLPNKDSENLTIPFDHSSGDFDIDLTNMFNITKAPETTEIPNEDKPVTNQSKEVNEIIVDDKIGTTTEKTLKTTSATPIITSSIPSPTTPELNTISEELEISNVTESKSENVNTIAPSDLTDKTTPKYNQSDDLETTSIREEIKLFDLFNTTDDFMSAVSKNPGYTVDKADEVTELPKSTVSSTEQSKAMISSTEQPKTTVSSTEQPKTDVTSTVQPKITVSTTESPKTTTSTEEPQIELSSANITSEVTTKTETTSTETELEDKTPDFFSYPMDNSSKIDDDMTPKFYPTTEETPKSSSTEISPNPDFDLTGTSEEEQQHGKVPLTEEDTIYDSADAVFTRLLIQANDKELCSRKEQLRDSIIRLFKTNGSEIERKQVVIDNLGAKDCQLRNVPSDNGLFPIQVYLTNQQGHNDMFLTDKFIDLWQREGLDFLYPVKRVDKVVGRRKWVEMDSSKEGSSSLIAAIVISSIAALCLLFIVILLVVIRKRQKGFNYGQRCTPVSLEDYSLDNISVYNSTRRKQARASKRSYGNPAFDDPGAISHVVNFATLANFSNNRSLIDEEFSQIPTVSVKPDELPPGTETKNRFANVIPIPETRVTLSTNRGSNPDVDTYINANYVKGAKGEEKFYIACQAPMPDTISDFWLMIWEQQSRLVIMLTDLQEQGSEKCADYLPPSEVLDCHRVFGDLQVTLKKREVREKYVISNLQLKNLENNLWREVVHLWLTSWPHVGVPSEPTSVIAFLIEARSYIKSKENISPIVIHCSPGTGRTGTIIAIDICIRDFEIKRTIDVPRTVCNIRKDRAGAVQTKDQYAFIYQVLHTYATKLTGGGLDSI